jgi:ParB family chromosome partitioning protein
MAAKRRGLGRGLDALLGAPSSDTPETETPPDASPGAVEHLGIDLLQRGKYQPRRNFDQDRMQELADSIAAQGIVQPIVVRPAGEGRYEIIAGERRWRAAQLAGLHDIPVVVREVDDKTAMAVALIENIQRDDLNPLEEATALERLLGEFGLTHQEVAEAVGKSRTSVTNLLRLLDLNEDVKHLVEKGSLEMGHARALLGLKDAMQSDAAHKVVKQGLSVRETERLVRRAQGDDDRPQRARSASRDPDVVRLEQDLTEKLGARVQIKVGGKGRGQLVIAYNSTDELEGILERLH